MTGSKYRAAFIHLILAIRPSRSEPDPAKPSFSFSLPENGDDPPASDSDADDDDLLVLPFFGNSPMLAGDGVMVVSVKFAVVNFEEIVFSGVLEALDGADVVVGVKPPPSELRGEEVVEVVDVAAALYFSFVCK